MDDVTILADNERLALRAFKILEDAGLEMGIAINQKKCEVLCAGGVSSSFPADVKRTHCLKLLGAAVGQTDDAERSLLRILYGNKFGAFFRRLKQSYGSHASALLAAAGVPKLNYLLRTHDANVSMDMTRQFDDQVLQTWSAWADCDADDISRTFAALPCKLGGLGFTRQAEIAKEAYESSRAQAAATGILSADVKQRARVTPIHQERAVWLDKQGEIVSRQRMLNMEAGSSEIFRNPTLKVRTEAWRAALRLRLLAPLAGSPATQLCTGCNSHFDRRDFLVHSPNCTRVVGFNASSRHACLKTGLKQILFNNGIRCDTQEPRDCRAVQCSGCKQLVSEAEYDTHAKTCKLLNPLTAARPRGGGPDIRAYGIVGNFSSGRNNKGVNVDYEATLIDVTVVALNSESHRKSAPALAFSAREDAKAKKYEATANAKKQQLVTFAVSENGMLSRTSAKFLGAICDKSGANFNVVRKELQGIQQAAQGAALFNAECRAGLTHVGRNRSEPVTQSSIATLTVTPNATDSGSNINNNNNNSNNFRDGACPNICDHLPSAVDAQAAETKTAPTAQCMQEVEAHPNDMSPPRPLSDSNDFYTMYGDTLAANAADQAWLFAGSSSPKHHRETRKRMGRMMAGNWEQHPLLQFTAKVVGDILVDCHEAQQIPRNFLYDRARMASNIVDPDGISLVVKNAQTTLRFFNVLDPLGRFLPRHQHTLPHSLWTILSQRFSITQMTDRPQHQQQQDGARGSGGDAAQEAA